MDEAVLAAVDDAVVAEMERARQPGLVLGVTDRDGTLAVRTYGFAELASRRPVTPQTLFEIGSIGKTFTAIAVLQLRDEGRIDLDAPVTRYLPWFEVPPSPGKAPPITIAHLLSHTAGHRRRDRRHAGGGVSGLVIALLVPGSPPGERFHYSNVGYKALGLVLEALEGRAYPDVIRSRILDPLGMTSTEPAITHEIRARLAVGYEYLHDDRFSHPGAPLAPATWLETATADGSIASTADDMCAFAWVVLRGDDPIPEMSLPRARLTRLQRTDTGCLFVTSADAGSSVTAAGCRLSRFATKRTRRQGSQPLCCRTARAPTDGAGANGDRHRARRCCCASRRA